MKKFKNIRKLTNDKWWKRGEHEIIEHPVHLVEHYGRSEAAVQLVPENEEHKRLRIN